MKKIASIILCVITVFTFAACNRGRDGGGKNDPNTIYIGNYNGAMGNKWLYEFIAEYEALHEGVQIKVDDKKDEFTGSKLIADMPYSKNDIYFLDHVSYVDLQVAKVVEDITETVTEKIYNSAGDFPSDGETATKSIVDMIIPNYQDFINAGTETAPKYYALPYCYSIGGIIYDVDLFNSQNLFFDRNGNIGVKKTSPDVGPGPDGNFDTLYDNGEPETWADFLTLLSTLRAKTITPFTWSGQYIYPRQYFSQAVHASYEGMNNMYLNFTLSGTDSRLGEITPQTGYLLAGQDGQAAAIRAAIDIMSYAKNYSDKAFNTLTQSHTAAQSEYVYSIESESGRIAMLLESSYWETEATGTFNEMAMMNPDYGFGQRNFSIMSVPNFVDVSGIPDQTNTRTTLFGDSSTRLVVMNKASQKKDLAKDFLQFVHTRSANATFTALSNCLRPFEYDFTPDENDRLTPYMKTVMDRVTNPAVDVVVGEMYNSKMVDNSSYFTYWTTKSKFGTLTYSEFMDVIRARPASTVDTILAGVKETVNQVNWPIK